MAVDNADEKLYLFPEDDKEVVGSWEVPYMRTPYNYNRDRVSAETGLYTPEPSLTVQEARDEVDINTIVRQFGLTGKLPEGLVAPVYGDFSQLSDYHAAVNAIARANETFDDLPAEVRAKFNNDPGAFVDFALDTKNRDQLKEWGMLVPEAPPLPKGMAQPNELPMEPVPSKPSKKGSEKAEPE